MMTRKKKSNGGTPFIATKSLLKTSVGTSFFLLLNLMCETAFSKRLASNPFRGLRFEIGNVLSATEAERPFSIYFGGAFRFTSRNEAEIIVGFFIHCAFNKMLLF